MTSSAPVASVDQKHMEVLQQAAAAVFNAVCGLALHPHEDDPQASQEGTICSIINLVGDVDWSIFVCLPRSTATRVAAKFSGFDIPFDSGDMGDAVGELANILAGEVKSRLDKLRIRAEISIPSVIRGSGLEVMAQRNTWSLKFCFSTDLGTFWTGIYTQQRSGH